MPQKVNEKILQAAPLPEEKQAYTGEELCHALTPEQEAEALGKLALFGVDLFLREYAREYAMDKKL